MDEEIARLAAERDIEKLIQRYCHSMDSGDEATWVGCFTETALFDVRNAQGEVIHVENGRDDLARYIAAYPKPPSVRRHLYTSNLLDVDVAAGTATGEYYWTLFTADVKGRPVLSAFGRSSDSYVKTGSGWKIDRRISVADAL